jgi:hypothetical protein
VFVKTKKSLSVHAGFYKPVRQKRRDGGVEIFYVILDPLFTSHTLRHISPSFSFSNTCQFFGDPCSFSILRRGGGKEISVKVPSTSNIFPIKHHDHLKNRKASWVRGCRT